MVKFDRMTIVDEEGSRGTVVGKYDIKEGPPANLVIELDSGDQVLVPWDKVVHKGNGYYLVGRFAAIGSRMETDERVSFPVIAEELAVSKNMRETGHVRVIKSTRKREETVDEPLMIEEIQVSRVAINRPIDSPIEERQEGDTLIIPVIEEETVTQKRLVLKEEIHITKRRKEEHRPQQVTLRRQEVSVERVPSEEKQEKAVPEN